MEETTKILRQHKTELEKLINVKCYGYIYEKLYEYVQRHPNSLNLSKYCKVKYPNAATLKNMLLEFVTNISVYEDTASFDAVVSCQIEVKKKLFNIFTIITDTASQWFRVSCLVAVEDSIKNFNIHKIEPYSKCEKNKTQFIATGNLVPIISKEQLDDEAIKFLKKYCLEALLKPMPVPINKIVCEKMGLKIIQNIRLTDDFSIFGQICFSKGTVDVFSSSENRYHNIEVDCGTILVDENTFFQRNTGCVNNTIAHEAFHWYRHRTYAAVRSILRNEKFIAYRCPAEFSDNKPKNTWTDEDWIEWQANKIAPRILMPKEMVLIKIEEYFHEYGHYSDKSQRKEILEKVISQLANFYKVSNQRQT